MNAGSKFSGCTDKFNGCSVTLMKRRPWSCPKGKTQFDKSCALPVAPGSYRGCDSKASFHSDGADVSGAFYTVTELPRATLMLGRTFKSVIRMITETMFDNEFSDRETPSFSLP